MGEGTTHTHRITIIYSTHLQNVKIIPFNSLCEYSKFSFYVKTWPVLAAASMECVWAIDVSFWLVDQRCPVCYRQQHSSTRPSVSVMMDGEVSIVTCPPVTRSVFSTVSVSMTPVCAIEAGVGQIVISVSLTSVIWIIKSYYESNKKGNLTLFRCWNSI